MIPAKEIAQYFLYKATQDEEPITNLKLQKLLYYAQGFHLALLERPLFSETIEKWTHGPVVPVIYREYKANGANPLPLVTAFDLKQFEDDSLEVLEEVYYVFGQFSGFALRNMTHRESPWIDTQDAGVISWDAMQTYFKTRIA